ncbi:endo-1,4-beta-xylanase [Natronoflexus pectinivorans]|uniref:Beta-xylanase n=1 Tax=Natronoflexus pectinivorans TaxID=682526 RepID=A0A4R2GD65_9BACT|nr:endo-1,4-beta-xylanase [Natronoflexus pectinivorans]TCO06015.1 endo-1,4-beta-xylanase [Natronoflexus pectinivorans]
MKLLTVILASFLMLSCSNQAENSSDKGLKDYADFPIGTATSPRQLFNNEQLRSMIKADFNSITLDNDMKMHRIMPAENEFNWEEVDRVVEFCQENNFRLHGHAFIWHSSTPRWLQEKNPDSTWLAQFMEDYILTYGSRYRGKVAGWDVVNEAIMDHTGEFRSSIWYDAFGEEFIARAFRLAHKADPDAILFYNDYNIERDTVKFNATLRLVERLLEQGVPISGIGFQMHIRMDIDEETIEYTLRRAAETGLQIHLSEIDVIFNKHDDNPGGGIQIYDEVTEEMLEAQGKKHQWLAEAYIRNVPAEQRYGMTFWGFVDSHSWIRPFFRLNDWPCLYDADYNPKPAYFGFIEGLKSSQN